MTRDEIMQMDGDALRLAVAKALGWETLYGMSLTSFENLFWSLDGGKTLVSYAPPPFSDWPHDKLAAIDLLDSMAYPDGVSVEYIIIKETYSHVCNIDPLPAPAYYAQIFGRNPISSDDYEATGDTLALAATRAWLMREEGAK